jgi:hypothetical protein
VAKYKPYSYAQGQFIPVFFNKQIQKGTFEYSLSYLIDNELDLSIFDGRFCNDETGAPAYDPRILLKIILLGCSRGIISNRDIVKCCEENIIFMALSANSRPHFTTIADFISSMDKEITRLFLQVLLVCDQQNLIGKGKLRSQCLRHPERTEIRQVAYLIGRSASGTERFTEKMKRKLDTAIGRAMYGMRLAIGEPPFAHIRSVLGLDRFSLRGKRKVNIQWSLFFIVHNLKRSTYMG